MMTMTESPKVYRKADHDGWGDFIAAMHAGGRVEIDEEMFYYWLEVLPPVSMGATYTIDGTPRRTAFGFCEGSDLIRAFWREKGADGATRFFCQMTDVWHRGW